MKEFLSGWKKIAEGQNGFRPGRSTLEHILALTCAAQCRSKLGKSTLTAFIDFQKAYDRINHVSLWQKLEKARITGQPLKILQCVY